MCCRFSQELGSGPFGKLYRGDLLNVYSGGTIGALGDGGSGTGAGVQNIPVFIKSLRPGASGKLQQDFQREAQLMSDLQHSNLLNLVGVCLQDHPWCMLYEFVPYGDLKEFLILNSPNQSDNVSLSEPEDANNPVTSLLLHGGAGAGPGGCKRTLQTADQLHIAAQVAAGMEFLASRNFIHRDLAARNVLIGQNLTCKICDFGIANESYREDYLRTPTPSSGVLLPVRWMPPEAIAYSRFSLATDVWSFGVLLWEIFSYGQQPYAGYSNEEAVELIKSHQLLACTDECPLRVYALMTECWQVNPTVRPPFRDMLARLRLWRLEIVDPANANAIAAPQISNAMYFGAVGPEAPSGPAGLGVAMDDATGRALSNILPKVGAQNSKSFPSTPALQALHQSRLAAASQSGGVQQQLPALQGPGGHPAAVSVAIYGHSSHTSGMVSVNNSSPNGNSSQVPLISSAGNNATLNQAFQETSMLGSAMINAPAAVGGEFAMGPPSFIITPELQAKLQALNGVSGFTQLPMPSSVSPPNVLPTPQPSAKQSRPRAHSRSRSRSRSCSISGANRANAANAANAAAETPGPSPAPDPLESSYGGAGALGMRETAICNNESRSAITGSSSAEGHMMYNNMCAGPPQLRAVLNESGGARSQVNMTPHTRDSPRSSFANRTPVPSMPLPAYVALAGASTPGPVPAGPVVRTLSSSPPTQNQNLYSMIQQTAFSGATQAASQHPPQVVATSAMPLTPFQMGANSNPSCSTSFYTETDCEV